jgi:tetratricopeptide (TPR) repeat protein
MTTFSVRDVERVLRLPPSTIRGLVKAGFVKPERGARRELRFSFQDLIVLRAARALIDANVPKRRITRALKDLRQHLPETMPLSGLSICAVGDRVVVRDGKTHWQTDDGQYVLGLDVSVEGGVLRVIDRVENTASSAAAPTPAADEEDWFEQAVELESTNPRAALDAYERAVEADKTDVSAWTNWGRLLHEQGKVKEAERVYRRALAACEPDALLHFNLGVALEDLDRIEDAVEAYQHAIEADPTLADGHFNLARLYEGLGKEQHAIRHLGQYRRLMTR